MQTETRTEQATNYMDGFDKFAVRPQLMEFGKKVTMGARTDLISCSIQVIANGGETNMHAHGGNDAIWLVLQGKARFYTIGPDGNHDHLAAELDKNEALVIKRETPYWFESGSDENLVILRFGAQAQNEPPKRIDYDERQFTVPGAVGGVEREIKFIDKFFGDD